MVNNLSLIFLFHNAPAVLQTMMNITMQQSLRGCGQKVGLYKRREYCTIYTKEQEEIALREYERLGSVNVMIQRLGYPSESTLYWRYERRNAGPENGHGHATNIESSIQYSEQMDN